MLLVLDLTLITAIKVMKCRLPGTIMEVGAHFKSLLKIKMVWILDHGVLENGCSSIVIIDQFWDGSFIYRPIGIWSFVYQLIGIWSFIYVCSAAQHSFLVCQRARRIAIHSIFSPTERVMRWWIAVSGNFLWIILLSSFLKVFGVKDHDGDQPVCLKCNSFSIAPNTKCSWVLCHVSLNQMTF